MKPDHKGASQEMQLNLSKCNSTQAPKKHTGMQEDDDDPLVAQLQSMMIMLEDIGQVDQANEIRQQIASLGEGAPKRTPRWAGNRYAG